MKKGILTIALLAYVAFSSGVMVSFHYCMDKLDSAELFASSSDKCSKCGMHTGTSRGCCRDEVKMVKLDDDQRMASLVHLVLHPPLAPSSPIDLLAAPAVPQGLVPVRSEPEDPVPPGEDLYLQFRVFRI